MPPLPDVPTVDQEDPELQKVIAMSLDQSNESDMQKAIEKSREPIDLTDNGNEVRFVLHSFLLFGILNHCRKTPNCKALCLRVFSQQAPHRYPLWSTKTQGLDNVLTACTLHSTVVELTF